jgi:cobalt-zinc-cadmium efflux system outer membrane protein
MHAGAVPGSPRRVRLLHLHLFILLTTLAVSPTTRAEDVAGGVPFRVGEHVTMAELTEAVRAGDPELAAGRRSVALSDADARQARLLGNPSMEASWSTIPIGRTTPRDLDRPYANVPNYAVGLGYTFPIGKRGPNRRRADAIAQGTRAELDYQVREQALSLASVLAGLASATLRREGVAALVASGVRAAELAEARLRAQFGTPLDVDQLRIEVERTEQILSGADGDILHNLAACASLVGRPCESFHDAASARAFLAQSLAENELDRADLSQRADIRALAAYENAASAARDLANARKIPDPTVRLGYLRDQFVISGNQLNSVNVGVSMPLPVFDHGQGERQSAEASLRSLEQERTQRLTVAKARIPALQRRRTLSLARCQRLETQVLPQARAVLADLEKAVENRLIPLSQVIQARRVVSELYIEEADSCGDAYVAALELFREIPAEGAWK